MLTQPGGYRAMSKAPTCTFCVSIIRPSIWTVLTQSTSLYVGTFAFAVTSTVAAFAFVDI